MAEIWFFGCCRRFRFYPGIQRIGYNFVISTKGGGKNPVKKQDRLLLMIAICGELPAALTGQVVGSDSYAAALITRLKQEGYISVRSKDGRRGYVLRAKGRRHVLCACGEDAGYFLRGATAVSYTHLTLPTN